MTTTVKCPTCQRPVAWTPESEYKPFCSKRCRLIDLGDWLDETHRISEPVADDLGADWREPDGDRDPTPQHRRH
jgi:endogenous inhibitor of DNA gyrase (YacG/DUF329 family)